MTKETFAHSESFEAFRARYLPLIRPEETLSRMRRALSVDAEFLGEFEILRSYLRPMMEGWADSLLGYLTKFPEFKEQFGFEENAQLRLLIREHAKQLAAGHFDEKYLTSLENIALFFIYHDVKSIWVAGAYQAITRDAIDMVFTRATDKNAIRVRQLMKILVSSLALELNQIQRVFIIYERRQYAALIDDLKSGAFLADGASDLATVDLPTLDPTQVMRVQDSFGSLRSQAELIAKAFCKQLFDTSPVARQFAGEDRAEFARDFIHVLAAGVSALSDPATLAPMVSKFGVAAAERGATPELYDSVREALIYTLKRASGSHWTEGDEAAWRGIYETITVAMIAAAFATSENSADDAMLGAASVQDGSGAPDPMDLGSLAG